MGWHDIEVRSDINRYHQRVKVLKGKTQRVIIRLKGRLYVYTEPEKSKVRIINIKQKFTQGIELEPGKYHVRVSAGGYKTRDEWTKIVAGEETKLNIYLEKLRKGLIFVKTKPENATVKFLNTDLKFVQGMEIEAGQYDLEISANGYKFQKSKAYITAGKETNLNIQLEEVIKKGCLYVNTEPKNATVKILNIRPKFKPGIELEPGRYHVEVSAKGYITQKEWIKIDTKDAKLYIPLEKRMGRLFVKTKPQDATVKFAGRTDLKYSEGMKLKPDQYELKVSAKGYETNTELVHIFPGETTKPDIQLKKMSGNHQLSLVEIILPPQFLPVNLSDMIELDGCGTIQLVKGHKRTYKTKCTDYNFPKMLKIPGFKDIQISPAKDGKLRPKKEQLTASFQVSLSKKSKTGYMILNQEIKPGDIKQKVKIPFSKIDNIKITAIDSKYKTCDFERIFKIAEAIRENEFSLPVCELDGCGEIQLAKGHKRTYKTKCTDYNFPKMLKILGFKDIQISPDRDGKLRPKKEQLTASFQVSLSKKSKTGYKILNQKIKPGDVKQKVKIPFSKIDNIKITALDSKYKGCDFERMFKIAEAITENEISLSVCDEPPPPLVEIILPPQFEQIDLSGMIELDGCGEIQLAKGHKRTYKTKCTDYNFPKKLKIPEFKDIKISLAQDGKLRPEKKQLEASFTLSLSSDSIVEEYSLDGEIIKRDESKKVIIALTKLDKEFDIKTLKPENSEHCNIKRKFTVKEALESRLISLIPPCKKSTIIYPRGFNPPEILDKEFMHITSSDTGTIECFHDKAKDITLSWGNGWNPVQIDSDVLKQINKYYVTLDKFAPIWPFKPDEPLFDTKRGDTRGKALCKTPPVYTPHAVQYCLNTQKKCDKSPAIPIEGQKLPNLRKSGWKSDDPLPTKALISAWPKNINPLIFQ